MEVGAPGLCKCGFNVFVEENYNLHTTTDYHYKWNDNSIANLVIVTGVCILPFQWMVVSASLFIKDAALSGYKTVWLAQLYTYIWATGSSLLPQNGMLVHDKATAICQSYLCLV